MIQPPWSPFPFFLQDLMGADWRIWEKSCDPPGNIAITGVITSRLSESTDGLFDAATRLRPRPDSITLPLENEALNYPHMLMEEMFLHS